MFLGESLISAGMVKALDIDRALEHQMDSGGMLGESLIALDILTVEQLDGFFNFAIPPVKTIEDTGLDEVFLMSLALKVLSVYRLEKASMISNEIKLPTSIVSKLLENARDRKLIESLGSADQGLSAEIRFKLSGAGREWVEAAMSQCQYVGPAPVPLTAYQMQTEKQSISRDQVDKKALSASLAHLVVPEGIHTQLGPAVNCARAILLYGAPGNGKTSIALALAGSFQQYIYVPYCIELNGQIINIYDPGIHTEVDVAQEGEGADSMRSRLRRSMTDHRWIRCRRPIAITGRELTLEMLDLNFDQYLKFYEAPLQVKATGGVFIIDDFGHQAASPDQILNRWVVPLERGFDYLTLHTGKKFPIRFDGLVVISTNLPPAELLDAAMMRRIPYNLHIGAPGKEEYVQILETVCQTVGVKLTPEVVSFLMDEVYGAGRLPLARYHPKFILERVIARCRYQGTQVELTADLVREATQHLHFQEGEGVETGTKGLE